MKDVLKNQLFKACENYIESRVSRIKNALSDLEESLKNETKSSAGDKYETSREMLNAEINQLTAQINEFRKLQETLALARRQQPSEKIQLGSWVKTSFANYFIAIPAGVIETDQQKTYAIGMNSPMAKVLLHKKAGNQVIFQQKKMLIEEVR